MSAIELVAEIAFSASLWAARIALTCATVWNIASSDAALTRSRAAANSASVKNGVPTIESMTATMQSSNSSFVERYGLAASMSFSAPVR